MSLLFAINMNLQRYQTTSSKI